MSQLAETSVVARDVASEAESATVKDGTPAAPVVITEQEVLFGTRAATSSRVASAPRRWIGAIRAAAASLQLPPPRQHYSTDTSYLERSRMAREMYRL
ncbi:hypothetical protein GCM10009641_09420 [Mycobacterium cookii]|uniref:Uncharacterized protein n=1 Tax=Mycobacterium cookii TaxID=1775 RepID=A0A7I7L1R7_9MYCO|nr:hypothetical protein MCOO_40290 [Mycobacterium cookii]